MSDQPTPSNENVIKFTGNFTGDLPVSHILKSAGEKDLDCVVVLGRYKDGSYCMISSLGAIDSVNWLLDKGKRILQDLDPCEQT